MKIKNLVVAAVAAASIGTAAVAPVASAGTPGPCRVSVGEFQLGHVKVNVHPPCELDVFMYNGRLNGLEVEQRVQNLGGYLSVEFWRGEWWWVAKAANY